MIFPIRSLWSRRAALCACALSVYLPLCGSPRFVDGAGEALVGSVRSEDGVIHLRWSREGADGDFLLEQSPSAGFAEPAIRYAGPDGETVLTGLPEGDHYFRVRVSGAPEWSEPLLVEVRYISEGRLFALLSLGFAVAALTVAAILTGHAKSLRSA